MTIRIKALRIKTARINTTLAALALALSAGPALADINVGVVFSLTGPAASLGAETKKAIEFLPATLGDEKINYIVLDDATDPTNAVKNARKLVGENKVDAIIGPNLITNGMAMVDVANETRVPMLSIAPTLTPMMSTLSPGYSARTSGKYAVTVVLVIFLYRFIPK